jgi:hypothetical protein
LWQSIFFKKFATGYTTVLATVVDVTSKTGNEIRFWRTLKFGFNAVLVLLF